MELKDKVFFPANLQSLSVFPSMLNHGAQVCGLNAVQQPLLIPWSNPATNPALPMAMMPMLSQPIVNPLPAPVSPAAKDSLILVPLSPGSSQGVLPHSHLSGPPISYPALQPTLVQCKNHMSPPINCTLPLAGKSVSPLPILSQPLFQSHQSVGSSNGTSVSVSDMGRGANLCYSTGSSPQEMMAVNLKNSCVELLKGKRKLEFKGQGRSSTSPKRTKPAISPKPDHSLQALSVHTGNNTSNALVNEDTNFNKQQSGDGKTGQQPQIDKDNISRIISSLPPGWKVVGLTSIDNSNTHLAVGSDSSPVAFAPGTLPIVQTQSLQQHSSPPDVVSVDLNVSPTLPPAVSSPAAMDNVSLNVSNMSKCSVHLCENPLDKLISVKSETMEADEALQGKLLEAAWDKNLRSNQTDDGNSEIFSPAAVSASIKMEPKPWASPEPESAETCLQTSDSQWTVVGVTSIPVTPATPTGPLLTQQNVLHSLSPLISAPSVGSHNISPYQCGPSLGVVSPKTTTTTILNVPLPKICHSAKNTTSPSPVTNSEMSLPKLAIPNVCNNFIDTSSNQNTAHKDEWTIVGVTVCPSPVKSPSIYSNAGNSAQLASLDKGQPPLDLDAITLEAVKSQMFGRGNNYHQQVNPNFAEMITALSALTPRQDNKSSNVLDLPPKNSSDEWKVVGITQLPDEQNVAKWSENGQPSNVPAFLSTTVNTLPTFTASVSNSNSTSSYSETLLNNALNRSGKSAILDSDPQQNQLIQLLNAQLQQQQQQLQQQQQQLQLQQQQQLQQQLQQHLQQGQRSPMPAIPLLSSQMTNSTNPLNTLNFLNQFQDFVEVLRNDRVSQNGQANFPIDESLPVDKRDVNEIPCCEDPSLSHVDTAPPSENSTSSLSKFENRCRKSKFQCIERCIGKSDCASRKTKDMCVRCVKKHTVSHLLKMKRIKDKDHTECDDDGDNFECVGQNFKIVKRLSDKILKRLTTRVDRDGRSRPLHSYAGNRKLFSKPLSRNRNFSLERISLRSGTQVPVGSYESDCNEGELHSNEPTETSNSNVDIEKKESEATSAFYPQGEMRSAARKRKLKVPRKMVADMDYHPFDSSSDSN